MKEHYNDSPENQTEEQITPPNPPEAEGEKPAVLEAEEPALAETKEEAACPSIFDKPDADRYKKDKKPRKKGSRQVRNIIISVVLCLAIVLGASGVCRLLYHKGLIAYISDSLKDTGSDVSSVPSDDSQAKMIFDYSHYGEDTADTEALALGGIQKIEVKNQKDAYRLESHWEKETQMDEQTMEETKRDVLKWLITNVEKKDIEDVRFSTTTVGFIVSDLLKISYDSIYAQDGNAEIPQGGMTYYEECGIADSDIRCTIYFKNGAYVTVIVGSATPTGNNYFLAVESSAGSHSDAAGAPVADTKIYAVTADTITYFLKEAVYYVDKNIIAPVEQAESTYDANGNEIEDPYFISGALSYFDSLSISGSAYPKDFVFKIVQEDQPGYDSIYLMTSPYTQNVDLDAIETLLSPVANGLDTAGCLVMKATAADRQKYGLTNPTCVVRYVVKDVPYVLRIGKLVDKENDYYAVMVDGNPSIMQIASSDIAFKNYNEADFASDTLYSCDITKVKTIRVKTKDGSDTLYQLRHGKDSEGEATLSVTTKDGKEVQEAAFRDMYVNLLSLTSFTNVTDGKDAANPYLTVTLTYNDYKQTDVIRLSPYTDRRYFMSLNGMGSTVVLSTAVDALMDSLSALGG